jgi:hypothetical protein
MAAICVGELAALAVNRFLDEDIVPCPSQVIERISWSRMAWRGSRFAARTSIWATLIAGAVALQARSSFRRPNPYVVEPEPLRRRARTQQDVKPRP